MVRLARVLSALKIAVARSSIGIILLTCLIANGCATTASVKVAAQPAEQSWEAIQKNQTECEASVAGFSTSVREGVTAGVETGLWLGFVGAVQGAAQGAIDGGAKGAGNGSWIGAAAGVFIGLVVGVVTGVSKANDERRVYVDAYKSCLRGRGYAIAGETTETVETAAPPNHDPAASVPTK